MIIGNGMVAQEFKSYEYDKKILIFASGVSNSKEIHSAEFIREKNLLRKTLLENNLKKIVYFSTCSMYDNYFKNNAYTEHKLQMEKLICNLAKNYIIFRLPQVVGNNNGDQLMGYLYYKILHNKYFELYNIERNLIDISHVKKIIDYIIQNNLYNNQIVNIANKCNIKVVELVKTIENIVNKKANYSLVNIQGNFNINIDEISDIIEVLEVFNKDYEDNLIKKYYE